MTCHINTKNNALHVASTQLKLAIYTVITILLTLMTLKLTLNQIIFI